MSADCTGTYRIEDYAKTSASDATGGGVVWIPTNGKYTESNCAFYRSSDSPFGVGYYDQPVEIVATTNGYDRYINLSLNGTNVRKKPFWSANVGFGIGF